MEIKTNSFCQTRTAAQLERRGFNGLPTNTRNVFTRHYCPESDSSQPTTSSKEVETNPRKSTGIDFQNLPGGMHPTKMHETNLILKPADQFLLPPDAVETLGNDAPLIQETVRRIAAGYLSNDDRRLEAIHAYLLVFENPSTPNSKIFLLNYGIELCITYDGGPGEGGPYPFYTPTQSLLLVSSPPAKTTPSGGVPFEAGV